MRRLIGRGFVAWVLCVSGYAETHVVDPASSVHFADIQTAIDEAVDGDTVLVKAGEYVIDAPLTLRGKAIIVRSESGPDRTTIRMSDAPRDPRRAGLLPSCSPTFAVTWSWNSRPRTSLH